MIQLQNVGKEDRGGAAHRQVPAPKDHRKGELCQGQVSQAHSHRQGGRHQDHRQDPAEPWQSTKIVQRGADHENAGPSKYSETLSGNFIRIVNSTYKYINI